MDKSNITPVVPRTTVRYREEALNLLFILFALGLRLFALPNIPGVLGDEGWSYVQIQSYLQGLPYTFSVPSGRMLHPLYILVALITRASDPFWMRFPSFLIGAGTLVLCFYLVRNLYGSRAAFLTTLLAATFPPHLHYSRLAWDCSFIPLFSLLLTYFMLQKRWPLFVITLIGGFSVHPSLGLLALPGLLIFLAERRVSKKLLLTGLVATFLASASYVVLKDIPLLIPTPGSFLRFLYGVLDFAAGTIVSQDPLDNKQSYFVAGFAILILGIFILSYRSLIPSVRRLLLGSLLSLVALYLLRGAWSVLPGHERSILYLGFPLVLSLALSIEGQKASRALEILSSGFYLAVTLLFYFAPAISSGGHGLQTRSGPEEPKYAAAEWIVSQHQQGKLDIVAEDWGIYWNVFNYALGHFTGPVELKRVTDQPGFSPESKIADVTEFRSLMDLGAFAVGFRGGHIAKFIQEETLQGQRYSRIGFRDYSGEDFIYVWIKER